MTLRDIAKRFGVSAMTVSRALRNEPHVRAALRERILRWCAEHGYRIHPAGARLATLRARRNAWANLAFLVARRDMGWTKSWVMMGFVEGIFLRAAQIGCAIEQFWLHEREMSVERLARIFDARGIGGLIILPENYSEWSDNLEPLWASRASAVVGGIQSAPALHSAGDDTFSIAMNATHRVVEAGFRRPGFAVLDYVDQLVGFRYSGGFCGLQSQLPASRRLPVCRLSRFDREEFLQWFLRWKPDCVITHNHRIAVEEWIRPLNLKVPRDISWVVLDVAPGDERRTGIDHEAASVGAACVDLVANQIHAGEVGLPVHRRTVLLGGTWRDGETMTESY
jgi:DNA-binding LacI/PurR family transcriptional regulator